MSQQWTPPPAPSAAVPVGNNLVLAIVASVVSLIFCCLPHGVISLIFATQVNKKAEAGDVAGAMQAAKQAKMFAWISIIVSVIGFVVAIIFGAVGGFLSAIQNH
jgi:membrane protein insertase Oxa1/YidC/SpoIIIJ